MNKHFLSPGASRRLSDRPLRRLARWRRLGARFNWILHFGLPPRYNKDVRVIQLDIAPVIEAVFRMQKRDAQPAGMVTPGDFGR